MPHTQKGESTQPTPPSWSVVQNLNCDLKDTLFISQDKDASTDVIPATKFKNRLSRSKKKGGPDMRCSSAPEPTQLIQPCSVVLPRLQLDSTQLIQPCSVVLPRLQLDSINSFSTPKRPSRLSRPKKRGIQNVTNSYDTSQDGNESKSPPQTRKTKKADLTERSSQYDTDELPSPSYVPLFRSPSLSSLPSTSAAASSAGKKVAMTNAEKQKAYRARKALEKNSSVATQKKKPMTGAERLRKFRATETEEETQQRHEQNRLHDAARREAEDEEETQQQREQDHLHHAAHTEDEDE